MRRLTYFLAATFFSFTAFAADNNATQKPEPRKAPEWTKEQREAMAKSHEAMAACLRSDKPVSVCHEEMMKACQSSEMCPMKDHMGMHGMMHGRP